MSIKQGLIPGLGGGGGGGGGGGTVSSATKRAQGGRGIAVTDGLDTHVVSLQVSGLLRGRNLDGVQGAPEMWALSCPAIVAQGTISARGPAQQFVFEADIDECDVYEVQFYDFQGSTPEALAALTGGIFTEKPQADGTPFPDTAVIDWAQSYAAWGGGYRVLALPAIRQRLKPVYFWWIPKDKPLVDFTMKFRVAAHCDWWIGSADTALASDV